MKRTLLFGVVIAMLFVIPAVLNAQKPKLNGTLWRWDNTDFLADVGTIGNTEDILFGENNEVTVVSVEWAQVIMEGTPRELVDEETGEVRIIGGMRHTTSKPFDTTKKGTYTLKKMKINKKKTYCVSILIDGVSMDYKVDGDSLIALTEGDKEPRVYKKQ